MKKTLFTLILVVCAIAQLLQPSGAINGIPNSDLNSGRYRIVSALRRTCGAGAKYLRRSCPIASDTTKLFMGDVPRRAGWWNVTLGRDASSIEVGGNQECQATPVLKQKPDCSLAMAAGRALKGWIMEPVKGQPDTFTIRSKKPPQGCGKQVYLGVPNGNCNAKKVQMYASNDGTGKQHWLMVPKGKVASPKPKPKPSKKKPTKKPQQAPGAPETKAKYHVRVDTKTKGKSCNEWLTKAQDAYDKTAAQQASTKLKNVWSVCQLYKKKSSRATPDLLISLFVKTNSLEVAKQIQADLVKVVNGGDFAEAVKILGIVGFTPKQVSRITPNCIIGFEKCMNLYGSKDLLPPMKPPKEPTGPPPNPPPITPTGPPPTPPPITPTCIAGQYLDSSTNTCKSCTTTCGTGKYILAACSATADTACSDCTAQPQCQVSGTTCSTDVDFTEKLICSTVKDAATHFLDNEGVVRTFNMYCSGEGWAGNIGPLGLGLESSNGENQYTPRLLKDPIVWSSLHTGYYNTCGLDKYKKAHCFGINSNGQVGSAGVPIDSSIPIENPVAVDGGLTFSTLSVGEYHICGVTDPGQDIYCWGKNNKGQLGVGAQIVPNTDLNVPTKVNSSLKFKFIATGYEFTCAISTEATDNGYCWGNSEWGSLGNGSKSPDQNSPVKITGGHTWKMMKAGEHTICGIDSSDKLFCWGAKKRGLLGDAINDQQSANGVDMPLEMTIGSLAGKKWRSVAVSGWHACALTIDEEVWCWGTNYSGEVAGISPSGQWPPDILSPTRLITSLSFKAITTAWYASCGVTDENKVYCWGTYLYAGGCGSENLDPIARSCQRTDPNLNVVTYTEVPYILDVPTSSVKSVDFIGSSTGAASWHLCVIANV